MGKANHQFYNYLTVFLLLVFFSFLVTGQEKISEKINLPVDSVHYWLEKAKETTNSQNQYVFAEKAILKAEQIPNDSLRMLRLGYLSLKMAKFEHHQLFLQANSAAVESSVLLKDSLALANAYWDRGDFYMHQFVQDSSYLFYSKAQEVFEANGEALLSARMRIQMANRQQVVKDYLGAEANLVNALAQLKPLTETGHLQRAYNTLGVVAIGLEDYERALTYFDQSKRYLEDMEHVEEELVRNANNMGMVYRAKGDFAQALLFFKEIVDSPLIRKKQPELYAKALSNLAFCRLQLKEPTGIAALLEQSLEINDSLGDLTNKAEVNAILAELHLLTKDTINAIRNGLISKNLALESGNYERLLEELAFLSQVDTKNAAKYAKQYIFLNDSLQREERQMLNRFARIQFETDEFIAQNEQLEVEKEVLSKEKQLWAGLAFGFLMLGGAIYIIITQRIKNQRLKFLEQQQANNQEIFNLMLAQKQKVDDAKRLEQKRISEELHDGVLGKMLGARMVLTGLNKRADEGSVQERAEAITALKIVENEIRAISHEMSHNAYRKINNFINSIITYLKSVEKNTDIKTLLTYDEDEDWDGLKGEIKINVYRMVQEALQNAIKHASCDNFFLTFAVKDNKLYVHMQDDGRGFKVEKGKKGIGMRNISSRVEKLNGQWVLRSAPGKGTEITLHIPIVYSEPYVMNLEKTATAKEEILNQH